MEASITLIKYRKRYLYFALTAMGLHSLILYFNRKIRFHKTLGCGKGGSFSKWPDWQQWGILVVKDEISSQLQPEASEQDILRQIYGPLLAGWWKFFGCETWTVILQPLEGHGTWDGKQAFGELPPKTDYEGPLAVLTRASIRISKLNRFWAHVGGAASDMEKADGFLFSQGIGEWLWVRQATLSFWQSKEHMKQFAYKMQNHAEIVRKTRQEKWYSEDMFVRFKVLKTEGTLNGIDPLARLLAPSVQNH